jgi:hypothetical protein
VLERDITVTVIVSSVLLWCYWSRYMWRLIVSGFRKVQQGLPDGGMDLEGLKEMLDLDNAALDRLMNHADFAAKRKGGQ